MKRLCVCMCLMPLVLMGCGHKQGASEVGQSKQDAKSSKTEVSQKHESFKKENTKKVNTSKQQNYDFISKTGKIDFTSKTFEQYFFHENHTKDFGPIKVGMTKSDVEKIYKPTGTDDVSGQTKVKVTTYGDIGIVYEQDVVKDIYLVLHDMFSYEEVLKYYGIPSTDRIKMMQKEDYVGPYEPSLIYNSNPNNGYQIVVMMTDANHPNVKYIKNMEEHHSKESNKKSNENIVNVLSDTFINQFNKSASRSFANVSVGMTKEAVDDMYGEGQMAFNIGHFPVMQYDNLGVVYDQGGAEGSKVLKVVVIPKDVTASAIEQAWGKPQYKVTKDKQKIDDGVEALIYDGDSTNDYIVVVWYKDNIVRYISKEDAKTLKGFHL